MRSREEKRALVLTWLVAEQWSGKEAAELLGVSTRHLRLLKSAFREEGIRALVHGNRARRPHQALTDKIQSIRQMLGHTDLPAYIGPIDTGAPYRPE